MKFAYQTKGVCARQICFDLEDGIVTNIQFVGGCPGNALALSKVLEGMPASFIIKTLKGNPCGRKSTSCADQLALAVEQVLKKKQNKKSRALPGYFIFPHRY